MSRFVVLPLALMVSCAPAWPTIFLASHPLVADIPLPSDVSDIHIVTFSVSDTVLTDTLPSKIPELIRL